jgi:hypothetical protein
MVSPVRSLVKARASLLRPDNLPHNPLERFLIFIAAQLAGSTDKVLALLLVLSRWLAHACFCQAQEPDRASVLVLEVP